MTVTSASYCFAVSVCVLAVGHGHFLPVTSPSSSLDYFNITGLIHIAAYRRKATKEKAVSSYFCPLPPQMLVVLGSSHSRTLSLLCCPLVSTQVSLCIARKLAWLCYSWA